MGSPLTLAGYHHPVQPANVKNFNWGRIKGSGLLCCKALNVRHMVGKEAESIPKRNARDDGEHLGGCAVVETLSRSIVEHADGFGNRVM